MSDIPIRSYLQKHRQQAEAKRQPLSAAIQQSKALLTSQIPLSEAVKKYPQCVDEIKIRLVQKQVKTIDKLPPAFRSIDTLYLSNNTLVSLANIDQFVNLKHLSVSNNNIREIAELKELSKMNALESLNMQGNPVTKHPVYRLLAITALPNLTLFDGKPITSEDKTLAEVQLNKQNALLDLMLNNYIEINKQHYISKKLDMHQELGQTRFQMVRHHPQFQAMTINLPLIKRLYDLQSHFPQFLKDCMLENLMSDVLTIYGDMIENTNPDTQLSQQQQQMQSSVLYEQAFSQLLMKQQHLIAELQSVNEKKVNALNALKQQIQTNYMEQSHAKSGFKLAQQQRQLQQSMNSQNQSPLERTQRFLRSIDTTEQIRSRSPENEQLYNQQSLYGSSLRQLRGGSQSMSSSRSADRKGRDNNNNNKGRLVGRKEYNTKEAKENGGDWNGSQVMSKDYASRSVKNQSIQEKGRHKDCCRRLLSQTESAIEDIRKDQHQDGNSRLKQQKGQQQQQRGMAEYDELQDNSRGISPEDSQNQQQYQQQLDTVQKGTKPQAYQPSSIAVNNQELELNHEQEAQFHQQQLLLLQKQQQLEELQLQLSQQQLLEEKQQESADLFRETYLKRLLISKLSQAVGIQKKINWQISRSQQYLLLQAFSGWKRHLLTLKYLQAEQANRNEGQLQKILLHWRNICLQRKMIKERLNLKEIKTLESIFYSWRQMQGQKELKVQRLSAATRFRKIKLMSRALKQLRVNIKESKLNPQKEHQLTQLANSFRRKAVRSRVFQAWTDYYFSVSLPNKKKQELFDEQKKHRIKATVFGVLKQLRQSGRQAEGTARQFANFNKKRLRYVLFKKWSLLTKKNKEIEAILVQKSQAKNKLNFFVNWRCAYNDHVQMKKHMLKSLNHYYKQLQQKYFGYFKRFMQNKKRLVQSQMSIEASHNTTILYYCMKKWIQTASPLIQVKQLRKTKEQQLMLGVFQGLRRYAVQKICKKQNESRLQGYLQAKRSSMLGNILKVLRNKCVKAKREAQKVVHFEMRRKFKYYKAFIVELTKELAGNRRTLLVQRNNEIKLMNSNQSANIETLKVLEQEKQSLQEQILVLKDENFSQQLEIETHLQLQTKYISGLRQIERQEKAFKEESETNEERLKEQSELIRQLHADYHAQLQAKDEEIHKAKNENRAVSKQVSILQRELEFKQSTLVETEKALLGSGQQQSTALKETDRKLQASIMMATEFRAQIETQEQKIEDLQMMVDVKEETLEESKKKLRECLDLVKETSEMYEQKFTDFQVIIESKNEQLRDFLKQQARFQEQVAELQEELHKQQVEIELFQEMSCCLQNQDDLEEERFQKNQQEQRELEEQLVQQRQTLKDRMERLNNSIINTATIAKMKSQVGSISRIEQKALPKMEKNNYLIGRNQVWNSMQKNEQERRKREYEVLSQRELRYRVSNNRSSNSSRSTLGVINVKPSQAGENKMKSMLILQKSVQRRDSQKNWREEGRTGIISSRALSEEQADQKDILIEIQLQMSITDQDHPHRMAFNKQFEKQKKLK